jgi:hypothetical protein
MHRVSHLILSVSFVLSLLVGAASAELIGWWRLDDGSGVAVTDSSEYAHHASIDPPNEAVVSWSNQGYQGGALDFVTALSGHTYVEAPITPGLLDMSSASYAFWMKMPVTYQAWGIIFDLVGEATDFSLEASDTGSLFNYRPNWFGADGMPVNDNQWHHVTLTFGPAGVILYLDGQPVASDSGTSNESILSVRLGGPREYNQVWASYTGMLDEVAVFNEVLEPDAVADLFANGLDAGVTASSPSPETGLSDVSCDVSLSWEPGAYAATHNVYFGTQLSDVSQASVTDPRGVLMSEGQAESSFAPGRLAFAQDYYWRVDEVNGTPDHTMFPGTVWHFSVEPIAYPIIHVSASASSANSADMGPEKTVDASGLNELDQHSADAADMWLSGTGDAVPWIQYEFDRAYKLHEMRVWNSNQLIESFVGLGAKDVTITYSVDAVDWMQLEDVAPFAQATGSADYTANTAVDFAGAFAKYVRLSISAAWGFSPQYGLSEVRFFHVPTLPREPVPASGDVVSDIDVMLNWRAGREAASHELYLGVDPNGLTLLVTTQKASADLSAIALEFGTTYYWQINEVNEAEAPGFHLGDVWRFATPDYGIVDDFDQYDDNCQRIFFAWADGLGHNGGEDIKGCDVPPSNGNGGGSIVGNDQAPFAEKTIVNGAGSRQSLPLNYDNAFGPSEATLSLAGQDWTAGGVQTLSLAFYGGAGNTGQLYVKINNSKIVYTGDITKSQWLPWLIDLSALGGLQNVTSLTIGVEGASAAGMLYIDDIRLYPKPVAFITPTEPDSSALLLHYGFDEGSGEQATDASGQGNHGTIVGQPQWVAGVDGSAIFFDGLNDYVSADKSLLSDLGQFTIACWIKTDMGEADRSGLVGQNDCVEYGFVSPNTIQIWTPGGGSLDYTWPYDDTDWHHIAAVGDGSALTIYLDGRAAASGGSETGNYGASAFPLNIAGGGVFDDIGNAFLGQLDDVRVYSRALSPEELAGLAGHTEPMQKPF